MSRNWIIAGIAAVCFVIGIVLSHRIEPGVRVQNVTLAEETPALEFLPAGPGPHPVALFPGSKDWGFCYGEALAAAGFKCFAVDFPRTWGIAAAGIFSLRGRAHGGRSRTCSWAGGCLSRSLNGCLRRKRGRA